MQQHRAKCLPPVGPHFLTNQVHFSNFGRGSLDDHLCQFTMKSNDCFRGEEFLSYFSFHCHSNQSFSRIKVILVNLVENYPKIISIKFHQSPFIGFRGDVV